MTKWFASAAAAASLTAVSACASPEPRYPVALDPLAVQAPAAEPVAAEPEPSAPESVAVAEEIETPRAAPVGRVETVALAQLPPVAPGSEPAAAPVPQPQAPAAEAAPAPPAADPALTHVVGPGDTFYAIGRRYGVGPQAVAQVNGLSFGDTLRLGQRIQLPLGARDRGPEAARAAPIQLAAAAAAQTVSAPDAASPPPAPLLEQVPPTPPASAPATAPAPSASEPERPVPIIVAPILPAPTPAPIAFPPATSPAPPATPAPAPIVVPPVAAPVRPAPAPVPPAAPASPAPGGAASAAATGQGVFRWPLQGDIVSRFGPRTAGGRSDGVNIVAAEGDPVRAAAGGTVVYAGDQVKGGFGKLVLVEHPDRWFTVYAHLSDIAVKMKQTVAQGQQLGRAGRTGNVGSPQLYFEVRHAPAAGDRARPVDPLPLLPQ